MLCKKVISLLSEYYDDSLDDNLSIEVTHHLDRCSGCRGEYEQLAALHGKLRSMKRVCPPEYLYGLVQHRIAMTKSNPWHTRLQNELARRWSLIRTIGRMWYITRALGTVMTGILFFLVTSSIISPLYVVDARTVERNVPTSLYGQQVGRALLAKFGMIPAQPSELFVTKHGPAINDLYFLNFVQNITWTSSNDTFSVITVVDQSGSATIENILEYPQDGALLQSFYEMITTAQCRPASRNGKAVSSHMILTFDKVSVYD
jgi:hypothetical protein